ncbi:MAG TPA: hypothetical protein VJ547_00035 [Candidatus Thermoplasmatota archaeon]|nr:hypothetical protein [Candidatus Thermoplasmatota archaeon]
MIGGSGPRGLLKSGCGARFGNDRLRRGGWYQGRLRVDRALGGRGFGAVEPEAGDALLRILEVREVDALEGLPLWGLFRGAVGGRQGSRACRKRRAGTRAS